MYAQMSGSLDMSRRKKVDLAYGRCGTMFAGSECMNMGKCLTVTLVVTLGSVAQADETATVTAGGGATVLPARVQSMMGPTVNAGYNFNSTFGLDVSVSPLVTLADPTELAFAAGLGPTLRILAPHSIVVGLRGVVVYADNLVGGAIAVLGYAYRGETVAIEALVGAGVVSYRQVSCLSDAACEDYTSNPHRYPAVSVAVSWPLL